jgi:hypothetical protein
VPCYDILKSHLRYEILINRTTLKANMMDKLNNLNNKNQNPRINDIIFSLNYSGSHSFEE